MPPTSSRPLLSFAAALLTLVGACQERTPAGSDSSLAHDLAVAQRPGDLPTVFNDAPPGAPSPPAPVSTPRPAPRRVNAPAPAPRRTAAQSRIAPPPPSAPSIPVVTAPTPSGGESPSPAAGVIGAGARVGMTTNARVCVAQSLPGDKLTATVNQATVGTNGAVIPAGATVVLEVASVERGDPIETSRLTFRVRVIDIDGVSTPAAGEVATLDAVEPVRTAGGSDRPKVVGGAVAGAVLGRIFGGSTKATVIGAAAGAAAGTAAARAAQSVDACLPSGSALRLTLSRDLAVRRDGRI